MVYALGWLVALGLLGGWSLFVWALHGLAVWSLTGAGGLLAQTPALAQLDLPTWLTVWVPAEVLLATQAVAANVLPWLEAALASLPSPVGWLSPLAWTAWGVGSLLLVGGAGLVHVLVAMTRSTTART